MFANRKAIAIALGCQIDEMNEIYLSRLKHPIDPQIVDDGPVKEVLHKGKDIDLTSLPVPKHHEDDAGPYVSAGVCILQQPDGQTVNMGMYRFMISSALEGGMFINPIHHGGELLRQAEIRNEPVELAVVIGHHPIFAIASQNNEPLGTDDYALAGGLLDEPLVLVPSETLRFPIPAMSEIVIEGELLPRKRMDEGPFGEYTMYYGMKRKSPVFRVKAITHRRDYIFHDLIPSSREHLGLWITPSKEANLYKKIKAVFPTLKGVRLPLNGSGYHAYVCIEKVRDGDGKNVLLTLLGSEYMLKLAIVVDTDVNIHNDDEVLWAISTRVQADSDIFTVPGARSSVLDPSSYGLGSLYSGEGMVTKIGIDATKPIGRPFANKVTVPQDIWEKIRLEDFIGN
jgi:2,5-furandicarboxylate decarboxylase 1